MNTTVWTGPDWVGGNEVIEMWPKVEFVGWRFLDNQPKYNPAAIRTGVIHPTPGQLGGGDLGDENDYRPRTPTYDWPFRETPDDIIRRAIP